MDEKRKAQMRNYWHKNKEQIKLQKQKYYQTNKESILKKAKEYRNNPIIKTYQKNYYEIYYQNNKKSLLKKNKNYRDKPANKIKAKIYDKERQQTPKRQEQDRERNQKPKRKAYKKKYHRRYQRQRRHTDQNFRIMHNLRSHFNAAMKLYSITGKIMSSKRYHINFKSIIKHLGPHPDNRNIYEADHIVPISMFNHNNPEQIKKTWAPKNFQWLTKEINQWKGDRLIKPLTDEQKIKLQSTLTKS